MARVTKRGKTGAEAGVDQDMTCAFVFSGGGSLAASQVGTLRALLEAGIRPDMVVGTSAGALNAVHFATHPHPAGVDELEASWRSIRTGQVAPLSPWSLLTGVAGQGDGLVDQRAFRAYLARACDVERLEQTALPVHVVATDLASGQPRVLSSGDAVTALLASTALPGIFAPVLHEGDQLVDGGVAANTPVLQAEQLGADSIWVLPALGPPTSRTPVHGAVAVALQALTDVLARASSNDVAAAHGTVRVLPAPDSRARHPLDFRYSSDLITDAYALAWDWLVEHGYGPVAAA